MPPHDGEPKVVPSGPPPQARQPNAPSEAAGSLPPEFYRARYTVLEQFSKGGMGGIWRARESTTGRTVAMKKILRARTPADLRRFLVEARLTAHLEHPNIVPIHELGLDAEGHVFYSMKLVQGSDLAAVLHDLASGKAETIARYPLSALLTIFQKVCDALAFAHSCNIIHRDLKPANIMLGQFGEVLVMDWGLAKLLRRPEGSPNAEPPEAADEAPVEDGNQTIPGSTLGTAHYMAPEQARGETEKHDARTDIYALGAILYHLLSLRRSVSGTNIGMLLSRVAAGELDPLILPKAANPAGKAAPALRHLPNESIPESLAAVVRRAMAFRSEDRYQSVLELQKEITAYQQGYATHAEQAGLVKQVWLALRRHQREASIAGVALLLLVALTLAAFLRIRAARDSAQTERDRATRLAVSESEARRQAESARSTAEAAKTTAEAAKAAAVEAERKTRLEASKADTDMALGLASNERNAEAYAHVLRALELDSDNRTALLLAHRLLTDGSLVPPAFALKQTGVAKLLSFSPDGRRIAASVDDGSVIVTDLATQKAYRFNTPGSASVDQLTFSPDGQTLAFGSASRLYVWSYQSSSEPEVLAVFQFNALDLKWPRPDRLVVHSGRDWGSGDRLTRVFALLDGKWNLIFGIGDDLALQDTPFSPAERTRLVECRAFQTWVSDQMLAIYDEIRHSLLWLDIAAPKIDKPLYTAAVAENATAEVSEKGGIAIVGSRFTDRSGSQSWSDPTPQSADYVLMWIDPVSRTSTSIHIPSGAAFSKISADGCRLLLSTEHGLALVERQSGKVLAEHYWKTDGDARILAFRDDGASWILLSRDALRRSTALIGSGFNAANIDEKRLDLPSDIAAASYDPTGKFLGISSDDHFVRIWSTGVLNRGAMNLFLSQGGSPADSPTPGLPPPDESEYLVDPVSKGKVRIASLQKPTGFSDDITGSAFSPDGARLVVSYGSWSDRPDNCAPSAAVLYDVQSGRMIGTPMRHDDDVFSPRFSPDGKWIVTASDDHTVRRWSSETAAPLGDPIRLPNRVRYLEISADSELIITGAGYLLDALRWKVFRRLTPFTMELNDAFFSPDGISVATVSNDFSKRGDKNMRSYVGLEEWEIASGARIGSPVLAEPKAFRAHWKSKGRMLTDDHSLWEYQPPGSAAALLPVFRSFRPIGFDETGNKVLNEDFSIPKLNALFPPNEKDHDPALAYARRLLTNPPPVALLPANLRTAPQPEPVPIFSRASTGAQPLQSSPPGNGDRASAADRRLNAAYARLRTSLNSSEVSELKREEIEWLKQRDAITDSAARAEFVEKRAAQLEETVKQPR